MVQPGLPNPQNQIRHSDTPRPVQINATDRCNKRFYDSIRETPGVRSGNRQTALLSRHNSVLGSMATLLRHHDICWTHVPDSGGEGLPDQAAFTALTDGRGH